MNNKIPANSKATTKKSDRFPNANERVLRRSLAERVVQHIFGLLMGFTRIRIRTSFDPELLDLNNRFRAVKRFWPDCVTVDLENLRF